MEETKNIVMYGLAGVEKQYFAVTYWSFYEAPPTIADMKTTAAIMRTSNPTIKRIFAVDNRPGLKWDYKRSHELKSIEDCIIFKDLMERYGLEL